MRVAGTVVTNTGTGVSNSGLFETFGNNVFRGNGTNVSGAITLVALQ